MKWMHQPSPTAEEKKNINHMHIKFKPMSKLCAFRQITEIMSSLKSREEVFAISCKFHSLCKIFDDGLFLVGSRSYLQKMQKTCTSCKKIRQIPMETLQGPSLQLESA